MFIACMIPAQKFEQVNVPTSIVIRDLYNTIFLSRERLPSTAIFQKKKNKIRKICVKQNTELHNWIISSPESVNIRGQIHRKLKKLILQLYFWHPLVNFFCILITATMKGQSIKFYSSTTYLTDIRKIIFYISFIRQHCCYYNCILGMSP